MMTSIKDIEIDNLKLKVSFTLENNIKTTIFLNSDCLSDRTLTKIFDDLSKVNVVEYINRKEVAYATRKHKRGVE